MRTVLFDLPAGESGVSIQTQRECENPKPAPLGMGSQVSVYTKQMGIDVHRGRLHKCSSKTRTEIAFREEDNEGAFYCDVNETNCDMIWKYVGEMK